MELLFKYYCTDWIATVLTMVGLWKVGNRNRYGFVIMVMANFFWLIFSILAQSPATSLANIIVGIMNMRGFLKWQKEDKTLAETTTD